MKLRLKSYLKFEESLKIAYMHRRLLSYACIYVILIYVVIHRFFVISIQ